MTDELIPQYVDMIITAQPDFIHVKGYTSIGNARNRMGHDKMPWFYEVKDYAKKILAELKEKDSKDWKILTDDERSELLPSGQQPVFRNRLGWARTYMKKAGLLITPSRAKFVITDRGLSLLK
jgi:wyosine [tRNA(Phe)-imidazoG37] synthetase (radical SAM superfamily)